MARDGLEAGQATQQIWIVDLPGLLAEDMGEGLLDYQRPYARPTDEVSGWATTPVAVPTSQIEAMPTDIITWSRGRALVATGLPIAPVDYEGVTYSFGQANNALLYPGLGLGTIVSGASKVTDGMLLAAAETVAGQVDVSAPGASLLPAVENLRASSATTAVAVVAAAIADGVATSKPDNPVQAVQDAMWQPAYPDAVS